MVNYRNFPKNLYFSFYYRIKHYCSGKCKYTNQIIEELLSTPYIDIPEIVFNDNLANNVNDIFKNYIYFDINTICNEKECYTEDDKSVNFYIKKFEISNVPFILSLNINVNDYNLLMKYKDAINKIFTAEINLYGFNYQLLYSLEYREKFFKSGPFLDWPGPGPNRPRPLAQKWPKFYI